MIAVEEVFGENPNDSRVDCGGDVVILADGTEDDLATE